MSTQKVVVVGAGMVGLSTAWFLQRDGAEVTVVDREDVAAGSSWGNAGWLAPALTLPLPEPAILTTGIRAALSPKSAVYVPPTARPQLLGFLVGFARHCTSRHWDRAVQTFTRANAMALDAFDELAASGDAPVEAPTKPARPHVLGFARDADREPLVRELDKVDAAGGVVDYTLLDAAATRALEPALSSGVTCGISLAGQRFINPGQYVHALAAAVKVAGGEIITGWAVREILPGPRTRAQVRLDDGARMDADAVVVANGSWLGSLARAHGVRRLVQAGRGYSFTVHPEQTPRNPIYFPTQRVACTPLGGPEDGMRVAGMMEFRRPDAPLDPRRIQAIVDAAAPMFRGIDWAARRNEWVGSRPCTVDGLPLVGASRTPGVYIAGGHGMWGIALGPLTGKLLAAQISRRDTDPLLRAFDPLR